MKKGMVYLIGAGPGDPGLITIKGLSCLKRADVVIYDYLANEELLKEVQEGAELIYVGKRGGEHILPQREINCLMIQKAQEGKIVARLKGGDPFIFGRGGEEAEVLAQEEVPFQIIPGVTAAVAVPAYAGIPLTHREYTSTVAFVTGHEDPQKERSQINWPKLATGVGTLVFLMGAGHLFSIVDELVKNGRDPQTPIAVIRWGTLPEQETFVATLATIKEEAKKREIKPPAIILIGEVVKLRQKLNWYETLPLFGKKILVTRSRAERLREFGAWPIEFPTIEIVPPSSWADVDHCLKQMIAYDWLIFTSVNGVKFLISRLLALGMDIRDLKGPKICAIGPKTAEVLRDLNLQVDFIPSEYRAEGLLQRWRGLNLKGKKFLIPRAKVARDLLPEELRKAGAVVDVVEVYQTILPQREQAKICQLLKEIEISAITFTSSSTAQNFTEIIGEEVKELTAGIPIASIGPITAAKVSSLGMETTIMPKEYTIPALVDALVAYFSSKLEK